MRVNATYVSATCLPFLASSLLGCTGSLIGDHERQPEPSQLLPGAPAASAAAGSTGVVPGPGSGTPTPGMNPTVETPPVSRGLLDCPLLPSSVAPVNPGVAAPVELALSTTFTTFCATCHGARGEGVPGKYPAIPGKLDLAAYSNAVRGGAKNMPAFSAAIISDDDLKRDFHSLSQAAAGPVVTPTPPQEAEEWSWTEERVNEAYTQGLAIWRKADHDGAACVNCHTPDAIDLAVIGYADDAIVRRATKHVTPEDAKLLVDFVHAQRRRFNVKQLCDPATWRPFQPGGEVLPGATIEERDDALGEHLVSVGLGAVTGWVETLDDAHRLIEELITFDLRRKLRIGVELPRWTDDDFNGEAHRNINDWITEAPPLPTTDADREALFALHDAYLADPTIQGVDAIDRFMLSNTTESLAFGAERPSLGAGDLWYNVTFSAKPRAALVASHYFRMAALGRPSLFEAGPMPLAQPDRLYNPAFYIGMKSAENSCFGDQACNSLQGLPAPMQEDVPTGMQMGELTHEISHPWFLVGWMFDHSFMNGENAQVGGEAHTQHYWHEHFAGEELFHETFVMTLRFLHQQRAFELTRNTPTFPALNAEIAATDPMLDTSWFQIQGLAGGRLGGRLPLNPRNVAIALQLHVNLMRAILFRQIELIGQGRTIAGREGLLVTLEAWKGFVTGFVPQALGDTSLAPTLSGLQSRSALLTTDTAQLIDQLINLVQTTPDVAPPDHPQGRGG